MPPAMTVLMPVYNEAGLVREAVASVLAQSMADFELLIVDDASTDDTPRVLAACDDRRIRVLRNRSNVGVAASLNRGIDEATAPLIARQDADDRSLPDRLGRQLAWFRANPGAGLCATWMRTIDSGGRRLRDWHYPADRETLRRRMPVANCICHGSAVFDRGLVRGLGGYRPFVRLAEDYDLWLRVMDRAEIGVLPMILYEHRINPASVSTRNAYEQHVDSELARELWRQRQERGVDDLEADPAALEARVEAVRGSAEARLEFYVRALHEAHVHIADLERQRDESRTALGRRAGAVLLALKRGLGRVRDRLRRGAGSR